MSFSGGRDPREKDASGKNRPTHTNYKLNLRTGEWAEDTLLEQSRSHFGCVAIGKNIYAIGGSIDNKYFLDGY